MNFTFIHPLIKTEVFCAKVSVVEAIVELLAEICG